MLQWMGGSRKKVTTARKSTEKRQKHYFEQKRRQHQRAGLEDFKDGFYRSEQNQKEQRSLDILGLQNLSSISQDCKPTCSGEVRKESNLNSSPVEQHIQRDQPIVCANKKTSAGEVLEWKADNASPRKPLPTSPKNSSDAFDKLASKSDTWHTGNKQELAILDLLGDGQIENLTNSQVHEAHVAFSVEGLGKMGAETPVHSPKQPDRCPPHGRSSQTKGGNKSNSYRNLNSVLDDLELNAMLQDISMPPHCNSLEFPQEMINMDTKAKKRLSFARDQTKPGDRSDTIRSSYSYRNKFHNTGDIGIASLELLDASLLDGRDSYTFSKRWRGCLDDDVPHRNVELQDYDFEDPQFLKRRNATKASKGSILESPIMQQQIRDNQHDFLAPYGNFDVTDTIGEHNWSSFMADVNGDNLYGEESCSYHSDRGKTNGRRHKNVFDELDVSCRDADIFARERHLEEEDDFGRGCDSYGSDTFASKPTLSNSISAEQWSLSMQKHVRPLFDEEYKLSEKKCFHSSQLFETDTPCSRNAFTRNCAPHMDHHSSLNALKHDNSAEYSKLGAFGSDKFASCQPMHVRRRHGSSFFSKAGFGAKPESPSNSPSFEVGCRTPDSSLDAASCEENLVNLTTDQVISENEEVKLNFQPSNYEEFEVPIDFHIAKKVKAMEDFESHEKNEAENGNQETSSSVKIKSENSVTEKRCHSDADVSTPYPNATGVENEDNEKVASSRNGTSLNSSPRVMMLGNYVLQLLSVKTVTKAILQGP